MLWRYFEELAHFNEEMEKEREQKRQKLVTARMIRASWIFTFAIYSFRSYWLSD